MRKMGSMGVMGDKIAKPAKLAKKATPRVAVCFDSFKGCVGAEEASRQVAASGKAAVPASSSFALAATVKPSGTPSKS